MKTEYYLAIALLAANIAAAARGRPIRVAFEGNVIFGDKTLDSQRQQVHDALESACKGIGAQGADPLTGGFDGEGYHFKYICSCAHGDTGLPYVVRPDNWWSAQATNAGSC
ncbi:hypothetical protein CGLO_04548 [Colletotrichum gloeosporioides Cg-14]|uniref:Uncharacterized protein n=1 Tax=Colletotrichum gloeosporioides (strain Cg-14) TaxID=1237896 RepID=T0KTV2_COLGC|nr:hypothetical protein CGLO_04548 [Colletotrichum gloeosporioides Cg-14]